MERPPHPEAARTLVADQRQGTLGTTDRNSEAPYTSLVEFVPMPNGDPLLFVSSLAEHTKNFSESSEASLLVATGLGRPRPLERERATLLGEISPCDEPRPSLAERYLEAHPHAETYIDFDDFGFFRLVPRRIRYIGGFGRMGWVDADAYREAEPDPVRLASEAICEHMNDDHRNALVDLARHLGDVDGVDRATLETVDRYGFDLVADNSEEETRDSLRGTFDEPLDSPEETREAFIALLDRARSSTRD